MIVYRFQFIISKAHGHKNYACGLLETLTQTKVLPQQLSQSMIWNRFANTRGAWDSNVSLDLHLEHENRDLKSELTAYRYGVMMRVDFCTAVPISQEWQGC